MTTLKPCPFCGIEVTSGDVEVIRHPASNDCILTRMFLCSDSETLVRLWNTRAVTENQNFDTMEEVNDLT
jgi:hypothetical protein